MKVEQLELVTDILSQALVWIKIDSGRERYATGRFREISNKEERGRMRGWLSDMSFGRTRALSSLDSKVHKASGSVSVSVSGRTEG